MSRQIDHLTDYFLYADCAPDLIAEVTVKCFDCRKPRPYAVHRVLQCPVIEDPVSAALLFLEAEGFVMFAQDAIDLPRHQVPEPHLRRTLAILRMLKSALN